MGIYKIQLVREGVSVRKHYFFISVSFENPKEIAEEYRRFYSFLLENCIADEKDIIEKKLKYLIRPYRNLEMLINKKQNEEEHIIRLQSLSNHNKEKLSDYFTKIKGEYIYLTSSHSREKDYNFYTNLLSWYSLTIDVTDRIIKRLYEDSEEIRKKQSHLKNYQYYMDTISTINKMDSMKYNYV